MRIEHVVLDDIDLDDESYRLSEELDCPAIVESLREVGQLNPVYLLGKQGSGFVAVCGFRRLRALRNSGGVRVLARIHSAQDVTPVQALRTALWDNLSHRRLEPLEIARLLQKLKSLCGLADASIVETYLPILGLPPHAAVLRRYLELNNLEPGLRRALHRGTISRRSAEILAGCTPAFQEKMARLLEKIHLTAGLQRGVLDCLEEVAALANLSPEKVLDHRDIASIVEDAGLSPAQRGEKLHRQLLRQKNPRFTEAMERFLTEKRKLGLPATVKISPDPYFENSRLHFEFSADSVASYREAVTALERASDSKVLARLFEIP